MSLVPRGLAYEKQGRGHAVLLEGQEIGWLSFNYARKGWVATGLPWFSEGRSFETMRAARLAIADALIAEEVKGSYQWP
jgi:apolipoprotein N-acyltransferase